MPHPNPTHFLKTQLTINSAINPFISFPAGLKQKMEEQMVEVIEEEDTVMIEAWSQQDQLFYRCPGHAIQGLSWTSFSPQFQLFTTCDSQ